MNKMPLHGHVSLCEEMQTTIVSRDDRQPRKHIAQNINRSQVTHYKIDGVVITVGKRCDFLLMNESTHTAYLIELKGSNLDKAAEQLESTVEVLKPFLKGYNIRYRIVASKVKTQAIESTAFKKFRGRMGNALIYKTNQIEEEI